MRVVCICLLSAGSATIGMAQERGLPDITIPVAPARPKITVTVSLVTGPAPEMSAEAIQLGGDSGLAIMQGVPLDEAEGWSRPAAESAGSPNSLSSPIVEPPAETVGQEPAAAASDFSATPQHSLPSKGANYPSPPWVKAQTSPLAEQPRSATAWSPSLYVGGLYLGAYRGVGPALKSETRELELDRKETIELNWPDDRPRYYLEQQGEDLFRRVQLADKEGYAVMLTAGRVGGKLQVDLDLTRNTLAGGRYDETINAYVGKPTLIKTICQTSVPIATGMATVVTWNLPGSRGVDGATAALARARYQAGLATLDDVRAAAGLGPDPEAAKARYREGTGTLGGVLAAVASAAPSGAMPGLAIVLSTQPLPAAGPPAPVPDEAPDAPAAAAPAPAVEGPAAPAAGPPTPAAGAPAPAVEGPAAPAAGPPAPARAEPEEAEKVGAHVQVDFRFVEIPLSSPEWSRLAEWRGVTSIDEAREVLSLLAHQKVGRVIASPSLVALDGHRAEMDVGYSEHYDLEVVPADPDEHYNLGRTLGVPLGFSVAVTPRLESDNRVSLALETRFEELLDKLDQGDAKAVPVVGTREANVRLQVEQGKTAIVRGLVRMSREAQEDGKGINQPVETVILVTPHVTGKPVAGEPPAR